MDERPNDSVSAAATAFVAGLVTGAVAVFLSNKENRVKLKKTYNHLRDEGMTLMKDAEEKVHDIEDDVRKAAKEVKEIAEEEAENM